MSTLINLFICAFLSLVALESRLLLLRAMAKAGVKEMPTNWLAALVSVLSQDDAQLRGQAVATIRAIPFGKQRPAELIQSLVKIAQDSQSEPSWRIQAAAAVPGGLAQVPPELFELLRGQLRGDADVGLRSAAVDVLTTAQLTAEQLGSLTALHRKAGALGDVFVQLVDARCAGLGLSLRSPRDASLRGCQVSYAFDGDAYAVVRALAARGVIGDFRAPDLLRFGLAPMYTRAVDVWDAVDALHDVLAAQSWRAHAVAVRPTVT